MSGLATIRFFRLWTEGGALATIGAGEDTPARSARVRHSRVTERHRRLPARTPATSLISLLFQSGLLPAPPQGGVDYAVVQATDRRGHLEHCGLCRTLQP
jgi:hypothetical protein